MIHHVKGDSQILQYQHNDIIITVTRELLTCVRKQSFFSCALFDELDFAANKRLAVNSLLKRAFKYGYTNSLYTLD